MKLQDKSLKFQIFTVDSNSKIFCAKPPSSRNSNEKSNLSTTVVQESHETVLLKYPITALAASISPFPDNESFRLGCRSSRDTQVPLTTSKSNK